MPCLLGSKVRKRTEVVLAEEEAVNAGNSGNLLHVLDGVSGLDLEGAHNVLVGAASIAEETIDVHRALGEVDRASAVPQWKMRGGG